MEDLMDPQQPDQPQDPKRRMVRLGTERYDPLYDPISQGGNGRSQSPAPPVQNIDITDEELQMLIERRKAAQEQEPPVRPSTARMRDPDPVPRRQQIQRPIQAQRDYSREPWDNPRPDERQIREEPIRLSRQPQPEERAFQDTRKVGLFKRPAREVNEPRRLSIIIRGLLAFVGLSLIGLGAMLNGSWYTPATAFHGAIADIVYGYSVGAILLVFGAIVAYHGMRGN